LFFSSDLISSSLPEFSRFSSRNDFKSVI
jgi:hypothetical protein